MKAAKQINSELAKVGELVERMKVAMLTTIDDDGSLRSRPLQTLELDAQGCLWFFTSASSPKVAEIASHRDMVNLSYADAKKQDYLSISGVAHTLNDRAKMKALWTPWVKVFFPNGVDDPDLTLLKIEIEKAEYWESAGSAVMRLYGLAKALTTGDKSVLGDNEKIGHSQFGKG